MLQHASAHGPASGRIPDAMQNLVRALTQRSARARWLWKRPLCSRAAVHHADAVETPPRCRTLSFPAPPGQWGAAWVRVPVSVLTLICILTRRSLGCCSL